MKDKPRNVEKRSVLVRNFNTGLSKLENSMKKLSVYQLKKLEKIDRDDMMNSLCVFTISKYPRTMKEMLTGRRVK